MTSAAIEFRSVTKSYGDFIAVQNLNLNILQGEFLVLLGPSGCGKSTILKLLAGIEDPSSGEIYVNNRLVNYLLPRDRNVAMVFQNYALYPHMSVAENIAYPLKSRKKESRGRMNVKEKTLNAAKLVEISDQLDKRPEALSGGQRQRVALARAIVRDPDVFAMDEPLSNLDAQLRDAMRQHLMAIHRRVGKATIYVTHDHHEAMTMADRIVVLKDGVVQQIGTPFEVFHSPVNTFVGGFLGHPKMNIVPGISLGQNSVRIGEFNLQSSCATGPEGASLLVGLRPTDAKPEGSSNRISGTVTASEFTGADTIVTLSIPSLYDLRFRCIEASARIKGKLLAFSYSAEHVHIFNQDGKRM
ncbi:MAG: ABC transporter ATP-binding protein [Rhodobacteraceae bacterium]|nr:ABC transporter ATP-binding protein [Paracoccaceae bacterium]